MRTIKRVVTQDKRKRTVTLRPKGTKPNYNGCGDVVGNGQMVSGSQVASKVFIIICDVELGNGSPEAIHRCHRPQGGALNPMRSRKIWVGAP